MKQDFLNGSIAFRQSLPDTRMYFCQSIDGTETRNTGTWKNKDVFAFRRFTITSDRYVGRWFCEGKAGKMMHHFGTTTSDEGCAMLMSLRAHQSGLAESNELFI